MASNSSPNGSGEGQYKELPYQVAGHKYSNAFLQAEGGLVLKPVMPPPRGPKEQAFYEEVFRTDVSSEVAALRSFLPTYYGTKDILQDNSVRPYLVLEDLTSEFEEPCVMDIKIGKVTSDPAASAAKNEREASKYIYQTTLGFRILGMKGPPGSTFSDGLSREYGRSLSPEDISAEFVKYVSCAGSKANRIRVVNSILDQLLKLNGWFQNQKLYQFYSSSLLFVYDCKQQISDDTCAEEEAARVAMIDFAHVFKEDKLDDNYIHGLQNLLKYFNDAEMKIAGF